MFIALGLVALAAAPFAGSAGTDVAVGTGSGGYFEVGDLGSRSCSGTLFVEVHPNVLAHLWAGPTVLSGHDVRWEMADPQAPSPCDFAGGWWVGVDGSAEEGYAARREAECVITTLALASLGESTTFEWREETKDECYGSGPRLQVYHGTLDFTRVA